MRNPLLFFLMLFLLPASLSGQSARVADFTQLWWINLGLGFGLDFNGHLYGTFAGSFSKPVSQSLLLTGRGYYSEETTFIFGPAPQQLWDGSIIAGLYTKGVVGFASFGAGLGVHGGRIRENSAFRNVVTIGLPAETQLFLTLPNVGLGVVGMANLNLERSWWGVLISLQFGKLR